jgi:hypothetical protein
MVPTTLCAGYYVCQLFGCLVPQLYSIGCASWCNTLFFMETIALEEGVLQEKASAIRIEETRTEE